MALEGQYSPEPFDHWIIDDFAPDYIAWKIAQEFPDYDSDLWYRYDNPLERKRTIREWGTFREQTYQMFSRLCAPDFCQDLSRLTGQDQITPDYGLHGAGQHLQGAGDHLNMHLDYEVHPRLGLRRRFNLIWYVTPEWQPSWGGELEFWSHNSHADQPREPVASIVPRFNRAVIFDTTQHSWHGVPRPIRCPQGMYRRSLAMYYLVPDRGETNRRPRALYAPRADQKSDPEIQSLIQQRSRI